jgi:transposase InsO family protein
MSEIENKTVLAKELGISRQALYYQPKKKIKNEEIKKQIQSVMTKHPAYGHRRIALELKRNKKPILRVMNIFGLRPKIMRKRKRPDKPEDRGKPEIQSINISKILCPIQSNVVWAGDFTYFDFDGKFWYLATVMDIHTREIIGWHFANHHTTDLIIKAFEDALRRTKAKPKFFHSDQGSEYVSGRYERLLRSHGVQPSFSRKSSPWQNCFQESFYSNFKLEIGDLKRFTEIGELIEFIHQQIAYYNNERIHTSIKMPPTIFRLTSKEFSINKTTALSRV